VASVVAEPVAGSKNRKVREGSANEIRENAEEDNLDIVFGSGVGYKKRKAYADSSDAKRKDSGLYTI